jgi:hypothetical protein
MCLTAVILESTDLNKTLQSDQIIVEKKNRSYSDQKMAKAISSQMKLRVVGHSKVPAA